MTIAMAFLSVYDLLKNKYGMQPEDVQYMMTIIAFPWAPKLFYGIITDTFPICGSTKKNYLILLGTIFCLCALAVGVFNFPTAGPTIALITVTSLASAMMDVVVDGYVVCQARLDLKHGSEDLQSFCWGIAGLGGVTGYLSGGLLT